jgi:DNA-binding transcriptional MerR regulator
MSEALLPLLLPAADSTGARAQKSISAFRTISEVAEELDVAQHVLRFWESKFTQVRPLKRGGGRRYYRPEDVDLLRQIRSLLYDEGYTIKGAQKLLRARRSSARGGTGGEPPTPPLPPTVASALLPAASARPPGTAETRLALTALRRELLELKELMAKVRAELG